MAPFRGFIGGSYTGRAIAADAERSLNLFPERVESEGGAAKSEWVLLSKPGLRSFVNLGTPSISSAITVPATTQPWVWVQSGQNAAENYGSAILATHSQGSAPVVIAIPPGYSQVTITASGSINYGGPAVGPNGNPSDTGYYSDYPRQYVTGTIPANFGKGGLIGAFTDSSGNFIKAIAVGVGGTYSVPAGASQLQLGINDDYLPDNTGSFTINSSVSAPAYASSIQALYAINARAFGVAGGLLVELFANGTYINRGTVTTGACAIAANQTQLLIVCQGFGWIFNLTTNTLTPITSPAWPVGASSPVMIDGYFIVLEPNSQAFAISALNDGTSWNALDFGDAEGAPGNVVSMIADHRQLWLLCTDHTEVYYDSGDANFPFSRLEGAFLQQGCAAALSVAKCDNTIFWLGADEKGAGVVWRANGYTPLRVSTHAVEAAIQGYSTITDATAYSYQDGGHTFYVLHFPSANNYLGATWVYDVASGFWHERGYWNAARGLYQRDLAACHCYAFGMHLVGDWQSGNVYVQSQAIYTDNGALIRRLRTAPDLSNGGKHVFYSELRLLMQTGVGLTSGTPGANPQVVLRVSNDGGFTWGNEREASMGALGNYATLVRWRRLGRSRNRAFQVICSEPVFVALIAADLDVTDGS